jgi:uncharacterized protein (DUF58 family)
VSERFPPEFVDRVLALPWGRSARRGAGGVGERGGRRGAGIEFEEHRAYRPGDDPSRIDWQLYARSREPFSKVERVPQSQLELVLVDASRSMRFGCPAKFDRALRVAAALALVAVAHGARATVLSLGGSDGAAQVDLERLADSRAFLALLDRWSASGDEGELERGRRAALEVARDARRIAIVSDLYDLEGWARCLESLAARACSPSLLQVLDPEELSPRLEHEVELIDAESGARWSPLELDMALREYAARLEAHRARLRQWADRHALALHELAVPERDLEALSRAVCAWGGR